MSAAATPGAVRGPHLRMRAVLLVPLLLAAVLASALAAPGRAPAAASPDLVVGIADQKTAFFTAPLFDALHLTKVRRVVPWDAMNLPQERAELDDWMAAARRAGTRPLLSFGHSRVASRRRVAPTPAQFAAAFRKLRARYPWATEFATWNEPNLCGEPLCHKPELAARYYDTLRAACPSCTILGAEVLDNAGMASWVKAFRRHVRHEPKVWGLHNYLDANRLRTSGTRRLLQLVPGKIWFTETGGIVKRRTVVKERGFPESVSHAAQATRWIFDRLVELSPRITRVYLYHWNSGTPTDSWDSALVTLGGRPRMSYRVLRDRLMRMRRARAAAAAHRAGHAPAAGTAPATADR